MTTSKQKKTLPLRKRRNDSPEENLRRIAALKRKAAEIAEQISERQDQLMSQMEELGVDSVDFKDDESDAHITGTIVRGTIVTMDEPALKKKLGATVWNKISTAMLDKKKLDVAIQNGSVSETDVAASAVIKAKKPYIKVSIK